MEDKRQYNEKPQWFIDYEKDMNKHLDSKADAITVKHIDDTQSSIIKYGIAALVGIVSSILGLYVLYYSGLAELKTQVMVIDTKLTNVEKNVENITGKILTAEITQ